MTSRTRDASARVGRKDFGIVKKVASRGSGRRTRHGTFERLISHLGRPLHTSEGRLAAEPTTRDDWQSGETPSLEGLSPEQCARLSRCWLRDGLSQHAAIAGLARFTIQLLALGAPPQLIRASQRASLDLVRHAEICFGFASAYGGEALGPAGLDATPRLFEDPTPRAVVVAAIREGCVGDTISAMAATVAAEHCREDLVAKVLRRMAVDSTRHAGLAWRFVRWALNESRLGTLDDAVDEAFEAALADHPIVDEKPAPAWMRVRGRLSDPERAMLAASTLREVIVPCADRLLADD
jgi:hypothetical protein